MILLYANANFEIFDKLIGNLTLFISFLANELSPIEITVSGIIILPLIDLFSKYYEK